MLHFYVSAVVFDVCWLIHALTHVYTHVCICTQPHTYNAHTPTHLHTCTVTHTRIYNAHTPTHTCTCTHTRTHDVHTDTHMHTLTAWKVLYHGTNPEYVHSIVTQGFKAQVTVILPITYARYSPIGCVLIAFLTPSYF